MSKKNQKKWLALVVSEDTIVRVVDGQAQVCRLGVEEEAANEVVLLREVDGTPFLEGRTVRKGRNSTTPGPVQASTSAWVAAYERTFGRKNDLPN